MYEWHDFLFVCGVSKAHQTTSVCRKYSTPSVKQQSPIDLGPLQLHFPSNVWDTEPLLRKEKEKKKWGGGGLKCNHLH
eukprot:m.57841 g.57841  ORF g.57841 m.57841 type:complete len:78 (+) comp11242_c0_seq16:2088-2321(+)